MGWVCITFRSSLVTFWGAAISIAGDIPGGHWLALIVLGLVNSPVSYAPVPGCAHALHGCMQADHADLQNAEAPHYAVVQHLVEGDELRNSALPTVSRGSRAAGWSCANELRRARGSLAVRWLLDQSVSVALWGARHPQQVVPVDDTLGRSLAAKPSRHGPPRTIMVTANGLRA